MGKEGVPVQRLKLGLVASLAQGIDSYLGEGAGAASSEMSALAVQRKEKKTVAIVTPLVTVLIVSVE